MTTTTCTVSFCRHMTLGFVAKGASCWICKIPEVAAIQAAAACCHMRHGIIPTGGACWICEAHAQAELAPQG